MLERLLPKLISSLFIRLSHPDDHNHKTAYDFSFKALLNQKPTSIDKFSGKVLLIVNTASQCGFTKQYKGLENLYNKYKDKGLVVVGIPSNDFGEQEPGNSQEIANFCKLNYEVSFPMMSKEIVSGSNAHPFYKWAKTELGFGTAPKWNFHKYLLNRHGKLIDYFNSTTNPDSAHLVGAVENALKEQ
jgi:glutathione peroxidase